MSALGLEFRHQSLQRVAQVPLAQVQLSAGEAGTNRAHNSPVVVAYDPRRRAAQGGVQWTDDSSSVQLLFRLHGSR